MEELNSQTATPAPFIIEAAFPSKSPYEHEQIIHSHLDEFRAPGREYFRIGLDQLVLLCERVCGTKSFMGRHKAIKRSRGNLRLSKRAVAHAARPPPTELEVKQTLQNLRRLSELKNYEECMLLARKFIAGREMTDKVAIIARRAKRYEALVNQEWTAKRRKF